ncbi:unnamed protein product [Auanema sp. JU1783]|nr:unnamed protein product [Auanema sp. JU1783]
MSSSQESDSLLNVSGQEDREPSANGRNARQNRSTRRNLISFWILGLCNNFAYVIMLSAAKDILEKEHDGHPANSTSTCREKIDDRHCQHLSTGSVLLADILPSLIVKITAPLFIHHIPFGTRHLLTVLLQASSFLLVACSDNVAEALTGVVFASLGSGLGEISYLALAAHYPGDVVGAWSSGTGGSGIFGALVYATLTDSSTFNLTPRSTLMSMLIIPMIFCYTYWFLLRIPRSLHRVNIRDFRTYLVSHSVEEVEASDTGENGVLQDLSINRTRNRRRDPRVVKSLLKYIIPLVLVYFGEYFINQGLVELLEFNCSYGFAMDAGSQYRWYQVLYQLGVFISRSSSTVLTIPTAYFPLLAGLQLFNAVFFYLEAVYYFVPHISIIFAIIVYEGLLGGSAYVNTFNSIHREIPTELKEYSMGVVSVSDSVGIVFAGFLAIPIHNYICSLPLHL